MSWQLHIANQAKKSLKRLPKNSSATLLVVLEGLARDPYQGDIRKIKGQDNTWRRRVGEYRIVYAMIVGERTIKVTDIERKTDTTYR